jgi:hypothetical protein
MEELKSQTASSSSRSTSGKTQPLPPAPPQQQQPIQSIQQQQQQQQQQTRGTPSPFSNPTSPMASAVSTPTPMSSNKNDNNTNNNSATPSNRMRDTMMTNSSNNSLILSNTEDISTKSEPPFFTEEETVAKLMTGKIIIGMADFKNLEEAERIHSKGGAEATVFDPALIYLLARNYSVPRKPAFHHQKEPDSATSTASTTSAPEVETNRQQQAQQATEKEEKEGEDKPEVINTTTTSVTTAPNNSSHLIPGSPPPSAMDSEALFLSLCYDNALVACKQNFQVAASAGLTCRASVWATLEALLPLPTAAATTTATNSSPTATTNELISFFDNDLPFSIDILAGILSELLEGGDSQHFVLVCEVLRCVTILPVILKKANISALRIRGIYLSYIELLMKLELFKEANQIIKCSDDETIANLTRKDIDMRMKCGYCKKDLEKRKSLTVASSTVWCNTCKMCVSKCSFCDLPVTGLLQWCPVCSHGGHLACLKKWFRQYSCCATGCGHQCCFSFYGEEGVGEAVGADFDERHVDIDVLLIKRREQLQNRRTKQLESLFPNTNNTTMGIKIE